MRKSAYFAGFLILFFLVLSYTIPFSFRFLLRLYADIFYLTLQSRSYTRRNIPILSVFFHTSISMQTLRLPRFKIARLSEKSFSTSSLSDFTIFPFNVIAFSARNCRASRLELASCAPTRTSMRESSIFASYDGATSRRFVISSGDSSARFSSKIARETRSAASAVLSPCTSDVIS